MRSVAFERCAFWRAVTRIEEGQDVNFADLNDLFRTAMRAISTLLPELVDS